jgi:hypothetical protein
VTTINVNLALIIWKYITRKPNPNKNLSGYIASRPALGPPSFLSNGYGWLFPRGKGGGVACEADQSPPSSAEVMNEWSHTCTLAIHLHYSVFNSSKRYGYMTWCLFKQGCSFIFNFTLQFAWNILCLLLVEPFHNLLRETYLRKNIPDTNGKELSPKVDDTCAEYFNGLGDTERKRNTGIVSSKHRYMSASLASVCCPVYEGALLWADSPWHESYRLSTRFVVSELIQNRGDHRTKPMVAEESKLLFNSRSSQLWSRVVLR